MTRKVNLLSLQLSVLLLIQLKMIGAIRWSFLILWMAASSSMTGINCIFSPSLKRDVIRHLLLKGTGCFAGYAISYWAKVQNKRPLDQMFNPKSSLIFSKVGFKIIMRAKKTLIKNFEHQLDYFVTVLCQRDVGEMYFHRSIW